MWACESIRLVDYSSQVLAITLGHLQPVARFPQSRRGGSFSFECVQLGRVDEWGDDAGNIDDLVLEVSASRKLVSRSILSGTLQSDEFSINRGTHDEIAWNLRR